MFKETYDDAVDAVSEIGEREGLPARLKKKQTKVDVKQKKLFSEPTTRSCATIDFCFVFGSTGSAEVLR